MQWFVGGTESSDKSDPVKIEIMLSHAVKDAREVYKTLTWAEDGDQNKFDKVLEAFECYCSPQKTYSMSGMDSGVCIRRKEKPLILM